MAQFLVNIDVDDLDRAVRFYSAAFGLKVGRRFGEDTVEMLGADAPIYLLLKAGGSSATPTGSGARDYSRHWTPVHLDFVVGDVREAITTAVAAGATLEGSVETQAWGTIASLADPFGHGFCLIEFSARGYDAIAE